MRAGCVGLQPGVRRVGSLGCVGLRLVRRGSPLSVAEKSIVCRCVGRCERIAEMSEAKPISSSLSASSMTSMRRRRSDSATSPEERWSTSLPGVATTMCGLWASTRACCIMSWPPTIVTTLTPIPDPSADTWSAICDASSRAGERIRPITPYGSHDSACSIGSTKAAVFPEPVSAEPRMSCPASAGLMHAACMGVGTSRPSCLQESTSQGERPTSSKETEAALVRLTEAASASAAGASTSASLCASCSTEPSSSDSIAWSSGSGSGALAFFLSFLRRGVSSEAAGELATAFFRAEGTFLSFFTLVELGVVGI